MSRSIFQRAPTLQGQRAASVLSFLPARSFTSCFPRRDQVELSKGPVNEKEGRILGMIMRANMEMQSRGIDPSPTVANKESLHTKLPGSYRTRLTSPIAPGIPDYVSRPLDQNGLKFGQPVITGDIHFRRRGDSLVDQAAKLIMRDGKLTVALKNINYVLNLLRQSPPPNYNPDFNLLLEKPPPASLPLDPVKYFTLAVDSVAPLLRIKSVKGAAGGGQSLHLPVPVNMRQRRRIALKWILAVVDKQQNRLSGKYTFAHRLGKEIIAIVEGRSSVWERRNLLHKEAVMNRANMSSTKLKKRGRMMR